MSLAAHVRIVARGKGRARPLTLEEARDAMGIILRGEAAPEAVGALLMVLRLRGEMPEEIAGFTAALRAHVTGALPAADLDWPSYAAGRSRGAPLYLLAARLVAQAGYRVSMHGWNAYQRETYSVEKVRALVGPEVRYDPLPNLCGEAFKLLNLRADLGLRSCFNTVLRMWNPSNAPASVQGVFHPSYRSLQAEAAQMLGQQTLSIIKGGGGEFECHPGKDVMVFGLRDGAHMQELMAASVDETRRLHEVDQFIDPAALWHGDVVDEFAIETVLSTAAIALWTVQDAETLQRCRARTQQLWAGRHAYEGVMV